MLVYPWIRVHSRLRCVAGRRPGITSLAAGNSLGETPRATRAPPSARDACEAAGRCGLGTLALARAGDTSGSATRCSGGDARFDLAPRRRYEIGRLIEWGSKFLSHRRIRGSGQREAVQKSPSDVTGPAPGC